MDLLRSFIVYHQAVPAHRERGPPFAPVLGISRGLSLCRAWRAVAGPDRASSFVITEADFPTSLRREWSPNSMHALQARAAAATSVWASLTRRASPDDTIITAYDISQLVTSHIHRYHHLQIVASPDLSVNERVMWISRPSSFAQHNTALGRLAANLKFLHLEGISFLRASDIQWLFNNAPNLERALMYGGSDDLNKQLDREQKTGTACGANLSFLHLHTLLVDSDILNTLLTIGYDFPALRVLAVPSGYSSIRWSRLPVFATLSSLLVGGLDDDQLLALLQTLPALMTLWLQHCVAGTALVKGLTNKQYKKSFLVPQLNHLRIEEGTLGDEDALKLIARRVCIISEDRARRIRATYLSIRAGDPNGLEAESGIYEFHLVDCANTTIAVGGLITKRSLGSWSNGKM